MGSLSKKLGQLSALSLESESSQIIRTIRPNKIPNSLSQRLDTTLKDSHDMKVFGLGTLASMANRERYVRFTSTLYGVYSTMEQELDKCCEVANAADTIQKGKVGDDDDLSKSKSAVAHFWNKHSTILRRAPMLKKDVEDVSKMMNTGNEKIHELAKYDDSNYTSATIDYMNAIREAGEEDRKRGTGRLLGHAYTRYLADLMGGSVLGTPTRMALRLGEGMPTQYSFSFPASSSSSAGDSNSDNVSEENYNNDVAMSRKEYVESIYSDLNEAGEILKKKNTDGADDDGALLEEVVAEAREAFRHNVKVYAEEPIYFDSAVGLKNIATGWVMRK